MIRHDKVAIIRSESLNGFEARNKPTVKKQTRFA